MLLLCSSEYLLFPDLAVCFALPLWLCACVWSLSSTVNACVCLCMYIMSLGNTHTHTIPAPLLSSFSVLQVHPWPPSHLQTSLTYSMQWLSASPRRQWRMFAQDCYQFQHTFSHSDDFRWTAAKCKHPSSFFHSRFIHFIPFQLGSILFCSVAHRGLGSKRESWWAECLQSFIQATFGVFLWLGGVWQLWLGVFSCCLACLFVSSMTWPSKVRWSIQEALRVILPDDGCFHHH